MKPYSAIQS